MRMRNNGQVVRARSEPHLYIWNVNAAKIDFHQSKDRARAAFPVFEEGQALLCLTRFAIVPCTVHLSFLLELCVVC